VTKIEIFLKKVTKIEMLTKSHFYFLFHLLHLLGRVSDGLQLGLVLESLLDGVGDLLNAKTLTQ
jgi:hypothetical protein